MADYNELDMDVHSHVGTFDKSSGSWFERVLFNNRVLFLILCAVVTIFLGTKAINIRVNADYNQTIPTHQPYIVNYLKHYGELRSQANAVRVAVTADNGTIINASYLEALKEINDQIYLFSGVDRPFMTSLWTPTTRWYSVTADGLDGGPVISGDYDGSPAQLEIVRQNIEKTSNASKLVSADFKSSMIYVPLIETNYITGKSLDYGDLARHFNALRQQYASRGVTLHIIGFAMIVGDMINAIDKILAFFAVSMVIAALFLFTYTRCIRSTLLVVLASLVAVIWQMGLLSILGFGLTPYSVLVPFLVFSIGMSHGAQKMNGVMQDIGRGTHPLVAARYTFRRLFLAGFAALICDMTSFAVLTTIRIPAIQQLAIVACIGVGFLIITNLMMLPMMLSFTGVSKKAAVRSLESTPTIAQGRRKHWLWDFLDNFTKRNYAVFALCLIIVVGVFGWTVSRQVQVGDLDKGAPELRQDSQYNMDNAYIDEHFLAGSDTFIVLADTPPQGCLDYRLVSALGRLQWQLDQMPEVQSTNSLASTTANIVMLMTENAPKWFGVEPNQNLLDGVDQYLTPDVANFGCSFAPLSISLYDHKARTLQTIVNVVQKFIDDPQNQGPNYKFSMAAGTAGIAAATNIVIAQANRNMLFLVYAVVIAFCLITFRSWRAVVCAVLPLVLTSILAQALMVWLGIGIKVATLPVVALGVGIGVDYALYVLSIMLKHLRAGESLSVAYHHTLLFTGRVVILTGITLATGVVTWIFAPIKFQADMGLLLAFMFLWNMLGAMILLPALAYFLLPSRLFAPRSGDA